MPRPEGYASMQFDQVESTGKQVMVECRHCRSKRLARSVASRKLKHLQQCPHFHRHLAELAASNDDELNDVPPELLHGGPQRSTQPANHNTQRAHETPVRPQFDVSLPTLLDGLGSGRRESPSTPLPDLRDWDRGPQDDDAQMNDATSTNDPQTTSAPALAPAPRPRQPIPPTSAPERAVASAHRAAQKRKEKLDNVITRAIYEGSLPFNVSDPLKHPAMAEFFRLVDYVPPNRHRVADDVYDHAYDQSDDVIAYAS